MSGLIFDSESETVSDALDLFSYPPYQTACEGFFITEVLPSHPLSDASNQICFDLPLSDEFCDLDSSLLCIKTRIKNGDATDLAPFVANTPAAPTQSNSVAFVNSALNSIFSGVEVKLNGVSVASNFFTNPYICYIQSILSYGTDSLKSKLALSGWEIDHDLGANSADPDADADSGFFKRAQKTARSKEWTLLGNIHNPITMQGRYMLPLVPISIVLTKARPEFCLHTNSNRHDFQFEITSAKLLIKRVKILSTYKLRIENQLLKQEAIFPLRIFECRPYTLDPGCKSYTFNNIFPSNNTIPDYAVVGLLRSTDYSGDMTRSPFCFENFSLQEISISFDQYRFSYECDYENAQRIDYTSSYHGLFVGGGSKSNSGLTISLEQFANGYNLYSFYFGREEALNGGLWNNKIAGSARLTLKFSATSDNPSLCVLVYSEQNEYLKIGSSRAVV